MDNRDCHYIQQVAELGETIEILASEDIRSTMGINLLKEGARINRRVLHRLLPQPLLRPIDYSILMEHTVGRDTLIAEGVGFMSDASDMAALLRSLPTVGLAERCFARTRLNIAMQNKLTVAYRQRPTLFAHSIRVAMLSSLIGEQLRLGDEELELVTTAGLFHDIGELHCDPAILDATDPWADEGQGHLHSHPVTGYFILREMQSYHPLVRRAVIEHHERLDGSGYPKRIKSHEICRPARILSLVDYADSLAQRTTLQDVRRILKLSDGQFDREAVAAFTGLIHELEASGRRGAVPSDR
ncbi:MAG: HD-GYP domain-containing protein [Gammaproteobacteria bacterium]